MEEVECMMVSIEEMVKSKSSSEGSGYSLGSVFHFVCRSRFDMKSSDEGMEVGV